MPPVTEIAFELNGHPARLAVPLAASALAVLRERLGMTGAKLACGEGECGACTILVDGEPVCACLLPAFALDGRAVTTIEGLWTEAGLDPVQRAFIEAGAIQCGFCTPGMILQVRSLLERNPDPDEAAIRRALEGNVCRCTGYAKILEAVRRAAGQPLAEAGE